MPQIFITSGVRKKEQVVSMQTGLSLPHPHPRRKLRSQATDMGLFLEGFVETIPIWSARLCITINAT